MTVICERGERGETVYKDKEDSDDDVSESNDNKSESNDNKRESMDRDVLIGMDHH